MYQRCVISDKKGRKLLFVELQNAVYRILKASLIFYQKLVKSLTRAGFKINSYDPCVANKMIGREQMIICWHVDNPKISYVNPKAVDKISNWLDKLYPGVTAIRGKICDYLVMTLDFSISREVKVSMDDYIYKVLIGFPKETFKTAPSPAGDHLFKVRDGDERKVLPEDQGSVYHHVVAQLLFAVFRVRRDIQTAVACITIHVKAKMTWQSSNGS